MTLFQELPLLPEISDITTTRLKFVGGKVAIKKLRQFNFKQEDCVTRWEGWIQYAKSGKVFVELYIDKDKTLYDILCFKKKKDRFNKYLTDYGTIKDPLQNLLSEMVNTPPPVDIYEEWYHLTEDYSLEDIYKTHWSEEWKPASKYIYTELHEGKPSDPLHKMAYILNHLIFGCIYPDFTLLGEDFLYTNSDDLPQTIRLLIAILRHLDQHPCRTCKFELLFPLGIFQDCLEEEMKVLLRACPKNDK